MRKTWKRRMAAALAFALTVTSVPTNSLVLAEEETVSEAETAAVEAVQEVAAEPEGGYRK